eukprot:7768371-Pyramimonas_sp.AAC.1
MPELVGGLYVPPRDCYRIGWVGLVCDCERHRPEAVQPADAPDEADVQSGAGGQQPRRYALPAGNISKPG